MPNSRPNIGDRVLHAEAVVAAAQAAFESQDWTRLHALTDAGSIVTLQATYLQHKRFMLGQSAPFDTGDFASPDLPEAFRDGAANRRQFGELAGVTTIEQAEALVPGEFLIRWAQARHPHHLVDGLAPWHPDHYLERRRVVGSIALSPDTVAVLVRAIEVHALNTLANYSLIAVLGDNAGSWALDASSGWLGLVDWFG